MKNLSQGSLSSIRDFDPGRPKYDKSAAPPIKLIFKDV